jgi:hypothetical protein
MMPTCTYGWRSSIYLVSILGDSRKCCRPRIELAQGPIAIPGIDGGSWSLALTCG